MILLHEMFKKHPQNQYFLVRGACFYHEKVRTLIIKVFGQGFYAVLSFTGQQYFQNKGGVLDIAAVYRSYMQASFALVSFVGSENPQTSLVFRSLIRTFAYSYAEA